MEAHIQALRINRNPLNLVLGTKRKLGLRIGYMEAALKGFYLNSIETGVHPQKLTRLLSEEFHCVDTESTNGLLQFLTNEGDRVPYQIMLPYLLSSDNINEFETIIHKRFFGVERFVRQGNNLYRFVKYTEERRDPIIWINDLKEELTHGIWGCWSTWHVRLMKSDISPKDKHGNILSRQEYYAPKYSVRRKK